MTREFGADVTINNGTEDPRERVMELTDGFGSTWPSGRLASPRPSSSAES